MVQVPVSTGRRIQVQQRTGATFDYAESRNYMGEAIVGAGRALGQAAEAWDAIEARYDEADATRIDNEYRAYERERLRTGENAYLSTQGFNAGEGMDGAVEDLRKGAENILSGARSGRARKMAERALATRLGSAQDTIANHSQSQMLVARNEQSVARIEGAGVDAIDARGTPQFDVHLGLAIQEQDALGARLGRSDEQRAMDRAKLQSDILARTVLAMDAEDGEPTAALALVEQVKDRLLPGEEAKLVQALTPRVDSAWADDIVQGGLLEGYMPSDPLPADGGGTATSTTLQIPFGGQGTTVAGGRYGATRSYGGHSGIDYAGLPAGTPVPPSGEGVVTFAGTKGGYGYRVEVDHGVDENGRRIVTTYSHLDGVKVKEGDRVNAQSVLGGVGSSGGNYGTHLHFEAMVNGEKVDPASIVGTTSRPGAGGVAADPRLNSQNMREAVDKYIAANPGISERRKQALYASADRQVASARQDRAQAEQDADRAMLDWLTQNKPGADDLTDIGQIPAAILAGTSPSTRASVSARIQATHSRIESRQQAAAAERADKLEGEAVFELYTLTDEELARVDMRKYAGVVGLDKLGPWIDRQQRAASGSTGGAKGPVASDRIASRIDAVAGAYGAKRGPDATPEERAAWVKLRGYVEKQIAGKANGDVSNEDLRAIVVEGMSEYEVKDSGWIWNDKKRLIDMKPGETFLAEIPSTTRADIISNMRARGVEPTPTEVWRTYVRGREKGIYE